MYSVVLSLVGAPVGRSSLERGESDSEGEVDQEGRKDMLRGGALPVGSRE